MWFRKTPKQQDKFVPKSKVSFRPKLVDVGVTYVEVTFVDGRLLTTAIYGYAYQSHCLGLSVYGRPEKEPVVDPLYVRPSIDKARDFISKLTNEFITLVNDSESAKTSVIGRPASATILSTHSHEAVLEEPFLEEIEQLHD